jgi:peptide/nickel transport system ATP-binding protein
VEYGRARDVFKAPEHPYTWGLLASMPRLDRERADRLTPIQGNPPSLINVPSGCAFHPRCPYTAETGGRSSSEVPELLPAAPGHLVRCHIPAQRRREIFTEKIQEQL